MSPPHLRTSLSLLLYLLIRLHLEPPKPSVRRDAALGPDVYRIAFLETTSPTIIRLADNRDLAMRGEVWVSEATGRVFRTRLLFGGEENSLTTVFGFDEALQIDVPIEMRESFLVQGGLARGVARYSRFRRFGVRTDETIDTDRAR